MCFPIADVICNRRHVLTEDDARPQPNVALWDVTKARQVKAYPPGTVLEDKERSLVEIISVRPWFTVDTHLGTPLVSLAETNVFDGELYAVDARGERQTFLESPLPGVDRANEEGTAVVAVADSEVSQAAPLSSSSSPLSSTHGAGTKVTDSRRSGGEGAKAGGNGPAAGAGAARAPKGRSVQDEVKVNLGDAALRGLFSRWVDQHLRLHGEGGIGGAGGAPPSSGYRRRDNGAGGSGGTYSSGDSDGGDSEEEDESDSHGCDNESWSASTRSGHSSQASPGGTRDSGGVRRRRGSGGSGSVGGGGGGNGRAIGDDTMLWVTETDVGGGGIQRTLLQKRVGEFDGREGQDAIPHWVMACVLHGEFHTKDQPKVAFFLAPWIPPKRSSFPLTSSSSSSSRQKQGKRGGGGGGGDAGRPVSFREPRGGAGGGAAGGGGVPPSQVSQRFTAPAQMLVSKVRRC